MNELTLPINRELFHHVQICLQLMVRDRCLGIVLVVVIVCPVLNFPLNRREVMVGSARAEPFERLYLEPNGARVSM